jgi:hypothetical protein
MHLIKYGTDWAQGQVCAIQGRNLLTPPAVEPRFFGRPSCNLAAFTELPKDKIYLNIFGDTKKL